MAGAPMMLLDAATSSPMRVAISSLIGDFEFSHVKIGTYDLVIDVSGFVRSVQRLVVNPAEIIWCSVTLSVSKRIVPFHQISLPVSDSQVVKSSPIPPPFKTLSELLDDAAILGDISHEEQAAKIGISRTTYFEVKAGRGGRKSRRATQLYLDGALGSNAEPNPDRKPD